VLDISVLGVAGRIKGLETGGEDQGAHLEGELLFLFLEVDGPAGAELLTGLALALLEVDAGTLIDRVLEGNGLGVLDIDGLSFGEVLVVGVIHLAWALLGAQAAGDALVHVHVAGGLVQGDREVPLFSLDRGELGEGEQLDVDVPADLDQFGRDDSHGAVVGGEGLIELCHDSANRRGSLHEIHVVAGVRQVQGGLHAGDAAADHHH
jgi:hypothetical protein